MPALRMTAFHKTFGTAGKYNDFFHWVDDPAEDQPFADAMVTGGTVDRSGATPVLRWTVGGVPKSATISSADAIWFKSAPLGGTNSGPGPVDVTGWWECDQYGRPFDLNDLLA